MCYYNPERLLCALLGCSNFNPFNLPLQTASKDPVSAMLEKARTLMPAKPAAPAKSAPAKSAVATKPASGLFTHLEGLAAESNYYNK